LTSHTQEHSKSGARQYCIEQGFLVVGSQAAADLHSLGTPLFLKTPVIGTQIVGEMQAIVTTQLARVSRRRMTVEVLRRADYGP